MKLPNYEHLERCALQSNYHIRDADVNEIVFVDPIGEGCVIRLGAVDIYCTRLQALQIAEIIENGVNDMRPYDPAQDEIVCPF